MVAISILSKAWIGYNSIIGKIDHLDNFKNKVELIIQSDSNIAKYSPKIYYETRLKSLPRILSKIKSKKTIPKDIYGLRIVYSSNVNNDDFLSYYIKYSLDTKFNDIVFYKDYISTPKENNYKSLHLGIYDNDCLFDIQIRNLEMDYWSKYGGASDYHK